MKKLIAMLLVLTMVLSFAACAKKDAGMSHADYMAAAVSPSPVRQTNCPLIRSFFNHGRDKNFISEHKLCILGFKSLVGENICHMPHYRLARL